MGPNVISNLLHSKVLLTYLSPTNVHVNLVSQPFYLILNSITLNLILMGNSRPLLVITHSYCTAVCWDGVDNTDPVIQVLIIGAGALGCAIIPYLAGAGTNS